jgi:antitoxin CptB
MTVTPILEDASLVGADRLAPLSERSLSKLRWRSRRGLLENDLFIERFFNRHALQLDGWPGPGHVRADGPVRQRSHGLAAAPQGTATEISTEEVREVLDMLRA